MNFEVGETVELFANNINYGRYVIDEIDGDVVYFTNSKFVPGRAKDFIYNIRKIIKPGEQLEWDW